MSIKCGVALQYKTAFEAEIKLKPGTKTSSLGPIFNERSAKCNALVPLFVQITYLDFVNFFNFFSNIFV